MKGVETSWSANRSSFVARQARTSGPPTPGLWRHSPWDALLVALAVGQGVLLASLPPAWMIACGLWWNANTISHNFIHLPFFRRRWMNRVFSAYLSLLLGFPQSLWRARHLAHHRGESLSRKDLKPDTLGETVLVVGGALWLMATQPEFFVTAYLPGWLSGLALCQLQGYFEHPTISPARQSRTEDAGLGSASSRQGTVSHYGRLYNWLFLNDGFHIEHHANPTRHWTRLPESRSTSEVSGQSRWPAALRWMEWLSLDGLEQLVARSACLQQFVLQRHESAFRRLQPLWGIAPRQVMIVGGGLFPRTALVFRRIAPGIRIKIVDARWDHLEQARAWLDERVEVMCDFYESTQPAPPAGAADLLVIPLAFVGDKSAIYRRPPARYVLVHDWIWRKRGHSVVISVLLLKRLNLVGPRAVSARRGPLPRVCV